MRRVKRFAIVGSLMIVLAGCGTITGSAVTAGAVAAGVSNPASILLGGAVRAMTGRSDEIWIPKIEEKFIKEHNRVRVRADDLLKEIADYRLENDLLWDEIVTMDENVPLLVQKRDNAETTGTQYKNWLKKETLRAEQVRQEVNQRLPNLRNLQRNAERAIRRIKPYEVEYQHLSNYLLEVEDMIDLAERADRAASFFLELET